MAPKSARGKKDKKGKKKGKKEEVFSNVDKAFCHLTITDLNRKLAHLRSYLRELEDQNVDLKKDNEQVADRKDVADFLQRKLDKREEEFKLLEKEFEHISNLREQENAEYQLRIKNLEDLNKAMKEQLLFEVKLLQSKLNSLEEFRFNRELLLSRLEEAEDAVIKKESDNRQALFDMEQKALIEKDQLKKTIEMQLLQLAEDFAKSNEIKASGYTRRLIRENIALHKEIDLLINAQIRMKTQYDEYVFRNKVILQNYTALEDTNRVLLHNAQVHIELIEQLTSKCEMFIKKYNEAAKERNIFEMMMKESECKRFDYKKITEKLQKLHIKIDELEVENTRLVTLQNKNDTLIKRLQTTFSELKTTIETFIGIRKPSDSICKMTGEEFDLHFEECEAIWRQQVRQNLLMKLLEIVNSTEQPEQAAVCTPKDSLESLYHPGDFGFIPGKKLQESLMDLLMVDVGSDTDTERRSRSVMTSLNIDIARIPLECQIDGNSLEDMEMGSLYIISPSRSEERVEIEEEPMDFDDAASSSDEKDQTFIVCDKPEDLKDKIKKKSADKLKPVETEKVPSSSSSTLEAQRKSDHPEKQEGEQDGEEEDGEEGQGEEEEEGNAGERNNDDEFPPFFFY